MSISEQQNNIDGIPSDLEETLRDMHFRIPDVQPSTDVPTLPASTGAQRLIDASNPEDLKLFARFPSQWAEIATKGFVLNEGGFSYKTILSTEIVTIKPNRQMAVHGGINIDGILNIDGELILEN